MEPVWFKWKFSPKIYWSPFKSKLFDCPVSLVWPNLSFPFSEILIFIFTESNQKLGQKNNGPSIYSLAPP